MFWGGSNVTVRETEPNVEKRELEKRARGEPIGPSASGEFVSGEGARGEPEPERENQPTDRAGGFTRAPLETAAGARGRGALSALQTACARGAE